MNPHPLALDPGFRERLIRQGLLRVLPPEKIPTNILKIDGRRRHQGPRLQSKLLFADKQSRNPPLCGKSGCECVCKFYPDKAAYGVHCVVHAKEASDRQQRYKRMVRRMLAERVERSLRHG